MRHVGAARLPVCDGKGEAVADVPQRWAGGGAARFAGGYCETVSGECCLWRRWEYQLWMCVDVCGQTDKSSQI